MSLLHVSITGILALEFRSTFAYLTHEFLFLLVRKPHVPIAGILPLECRSAVADLARKLP